MYILQNIVFKKQKVKKNFNNEMISEKFGENNHLYVVNYHRMAGLCLLNNNRDIIFEYKIQNAVKLKHFAEKLIFILFLRFLRIFLLKICPSRHTAVNKDNL